MMVAAMEGANWLGRCFCIWEKEMHSPASPIAYMETKAWMLWPAIFFVIDVRKSIWCSV